MANKPDDPKKRAPDKNDPSKPDLGKKKPPTESDSAIDLGTPEEAIEASGISVIEWASLVEEPVPPPAPPKGVKGPATQFEVGAPATHFQMDVDSPGTHFQVDSPSDIDMLAEAEAALPLASPADAGHSGLDLGADDIVEEVIDDSAIDFGADIQVVEMAPEAAIDLPPDVYSGIDLTDAVRADSSVGMSPEADQSGIDLDQEAIELAEEDVLAMSPPTESGISLEDFVPQPEGGSGVSSLAPGESGIDLIAEDVILEEPISSSGSGSKRDLIAEGLESGLNLLDENESKEGKSEEDALDDFLAHVGTEDPTSAVDLGSAHTINVFKDEDIGLSKKEPAIEEEIDLDVLHEISADVVIESEAEPAIDLGETDALDLGASGRFPETESPADEPIDLDGLGAEIELEQPPPTTKTRKTPLVDTSEGEDEVAKADKKKPAPEPKPRSRVGAWMGGLVLGGMMSAAACIGVWIFSEPPREWRTTVLETVGMDAPKDDNKPSGGDGKVTPPVVTFANTADKIKSGDFDKITPDELAKLDANDASQLVARAEVIWLNYVKAQRGKNLQATAEPVVKALADLNSAIEKNNADGLFLRGQIHEMTGNAKAAEVDYKSGADKFKADAEQKERFEAALLAMDISRKTAGLLPKRVTPQMLAMVLIHLQAAQQPGGDPPAKTPDEAGFRFWQAIKAMRDNKVADALKLLDEARSRHDERRFILLRKPQNPLSDPREEIFLRVCDELKEYWSLRGKLRNPSYLAEDNKDRDAAIDSLVKKADDAARAAQLKELADKLVKDKPVAKPDDLLKLIADERKASGDKITDLEKNVDDQKKAIVKLEDENKDANTKLKTTADLLTASTTREKEMQESLKSANAILGDVAGAVNVKFKDAKTSGAELLKEAKDVARVAAMKDPTGTIRKLEGEQVVDRAKLKERWEPAEMLPFWLSVLESDRSRTDLHPSIEKDLRRVENDPASKEIDKARAKALAGLMLRNDDKFKESEATLKKAKEGLTDAKSKWGVVVDAALAEVSNPAATFSRRAEELVAKNKSAEAVAVLKKALDIVPDKKGALYARRATIALDGAKSQGAIAEDDAVVKSAKADAEAAVKEGLAEGHYLLGRIAEETNKLPDAITSYRAAVNAHKALDEDGSRYRVALARALLKTRVEVPGIRPAPPKDRTGKATPKPGVKNQPVSLDLLTVLLTLAVDAPGLPDTTANAKEAEKLADEILALGNKAPFDARASALAVKGLYTRALNTYLEGLREKGLLSPAYANGLLELVRDHPVLKRPESLSIPDPTAGEKAYAAGMTFYAAKKYVEAEREFLAAVENDNGDARYYYYLGLSRLAQDKRDGYEDFDTGARLERLGRPDRATVSQSLERVQGPMRKALNEVRSRPARDRGK